MRHAQSGVATAVQGCYLYAIGGCDRHRQAYYDIVEWYNVDIQEWESFHRLTHPHAWSSVIYTLLVGATDIDRIIMTLLNNIMLIGTIS